MGYSEDNPSDRRQHKAYHDKIVNGHPYVRYRSEKQIFEDDRCFVTLIDRDSSRHEIARAEDVGIVGYSESAYQSRPFDKSGLSDPDTQVKVFLLHIGDHTVGILVIELTELKWDKSWDEYDTQVKPITVAPGSMLWSGSFVWIHMNYRRKGLAKILVQVAANQVGVPIDAFAYSSQLSQEGKELPRSM